MIRIDHFLGIDAPVENKVTVKEIVRDRQTAEAEVARLSALNSHKDCRYVCQMTRLFAPGESFGTHSDSESDA